MTNPNSPLFRGDNIPGHKEHVAVGPEADTGVLPPDEALGTVVLAAANQAGADPEDGQLRTIEVGGDKFTTDLPAGLDIVEDRIFNPGRQFGGMPTLPREGLRPVALDDLPVGSYTVTGTVTTVDESFQESDMILSRTITVKPARHGRVVTTESLGEGAEWRMQPDSRQLMEAMGYEVAPVNGHEAIVAIPTPDTLRSAVAELGVNIHYFPEADTIDGVDYLEAHRSGLYPVALGYSGWYKHDIEDDHLTARILGGQPLTDALAEAAGRALDTHDRQVIDAAALYTDQVTAVLRTVVSSHSEFAGSEFGVEKGRGTFLSYCAMLGISEESGNQILATAQENGRRFGLEVKPLV